jgi:serine/threonine-protein phosphatase PGAM5
MTPSTAFETLRTVPGLVRTRQQGVVRHIILVRHGQYEEGPELDSDRVLTPLGRIQAHRTGLRLMQLARGGIPSVLFGDPRGSDGLARYDGPCRVRALHVSDMQRSKETASIIASYLLPVFPDLTVTPPDPLLNEALPCPMIPVRPDIPDAEAEIDANHDRIEAAFRRYVHRADDNRSDDGPGNGGGGSRVDDRSEKPETPANRDALAGDDRISKRRLEEKIVPVRGSRDDADDEGKEGTGLRHEFEIIVGHGNVIRYFVCRGLQLPPEAWLRFSVFNCSITYVVISPAGYVSVRSLGDTGHLSYDETTFSGSYGYNW